ncbi:MAG: nucleoside monophosphate kinase [bacterium]|nr:nucleoside monophosphate kinase [bacterium]
MNFPIIGAKKAGVTEVFDLADPSSRKEYFQAKVGEEVAEIRKFLSHDNFLAYFVGKKNSGKGTYSKLFSEIVGGEKIVHLSIGDLVRETHANWEKISQGSEGQRLRVLYRGPLSFEEAEASLLGRSASQLLPTEFILALLRLKMEEYEGKSVFLDGFPREKDQIGYTLLLKDLLGRKNDKDLFILIDIPDSVINERIKYRVICPICQTPRNPKLLVTKFVGFDTEKGEYYLMCDNPSCNKARMVRKEGDDLGIAPIKDRLAKDEEIIQQIYNTYGIPKVLLRNSIPVDKAKECFDDYEFTPAYSFEKEGGQIITKENPWVVQDNEGVDSYSLMPSPVVVALIKQMAQVLGSR